MKILIQVILVLLLQAAGLYLGDYIYYLQHGYSIMHPKAEK